MTLGCMQKEGSKVDKIPAKIILKPPKAPVWVSEIPRPDFVKFPVKTCFWVSKISLAEAAQLPNVKLPHQNNGKS